MLAMCLAVGLGALILLLYACSWAALIWFEFYLWCECL